MPELETEIDPSSPHVWGVFNSDGCECTDLEGVFATEVEAEQAAEEIRKPILRWHELERYAWRGSVDVIKLYLGLYHMPLEHRMLLNRGLIGESADA